MYMHAHTVSSLSFPQKSVGIKECKTSKCAGITMRVMCEWGAAIPQATNSVSIRTQAKTEIAMVSFNSLDAWQ